jgi:phosphoenolpyruvate carboxykinase (GTP)
MGDILGDKAPRCFYVNWFRKDETGRWLWPGFGENSRVLKWMCERIEGKVDAVDTPIGRMPRKTALDLIGLDVSDADLDELLRVDVAQWPEEIRQITEYLETFGRKLPARLNAQLEQLKVRLG